MKRKRELRWDSEGEGEEEEGPLAILWDIDNCCIPSRLPPEIVADNTRKYLRRHGVKAPITLFSAYGDFTNRSLSRSESCQWSGVNLIHVPNGKKDAADKAILLDMLLFAMDNPPPSAILLISGDVDFAAALHKLAQRGHSILLAAVNLNQTSNALLRAAKFVWEWPQMASNGTSTSNPNQIQSLPNVAGNYSETIRESNPTLSMYVSGLRLFAEASKRIPASLMQHSNSKQSGIDVVKEEILSLIHRMGGSITVGEIPPLYQHTFKKTLNIKRYGCKLKQLLENMGDDIHMHGEGNTKCVCLISQGKCLCPHSNAPNQKNVTEAGGGLASETEIESNGSQMMEASNEYGLPKPYPILWEQACNITMSACGLPYDTTKPESTKVFNININALKGELLTLLRSRVEGIALYKFPRLYEKEFNKPLILKQYGWRLKTVLEDMSQNMHIYMCGTGNTRRVFLRQQGSTKAE